MPGKRARRVWREAARKRPEFTRNERGTSLGSPPYPDPTQRDRLVEIRDNLTARIAEAEREGWLGEVEGLQLSLAGAQDKLAQIGRRGPSRIVELGVPSPTST